MRCNICDFSLSSPSAYHTGLYRSAPGRTFVKDKHHGGYLCGDCYSVVNDAHNELILPDEEVVFNSPTFKTTKTK